MASWNAGLNLDKVFTELCHHKNVTCIWNILCYATVGECLSNNQSFTSSVTGLTISPKKNFCIIKLWMSNCNYKHNTLINDFELLNSHNCILKKHTPEY